MSSVRGTVQERFAITACQDALLGVLQDLHIPPPSVLANERIHILPKNDPFFEESPYEDTHAFYEKGHLYLPREPLVNFAFHASHELAHTLSHHSVSVEVSITQKKIYTQHRHEGLHFNPASKRKDPHPLFMGFNEGVTEQLARSVRHRLTKDHPDSFSETERHFLNNTHSFPKHVSFVIQCLLEADENALSIGKAWRMLVRDEIQGTYAFLKFLEKIHPGSSKIIAHMGLKDEDVHKAAISMGGRFLGLAAATS